MPDHCETLTGLAMYVGGSYNGLCVLTEFSEFVMIAEIANISTSIFVSSSAEVASCAYETHNDFTNFSELFLLFEIGS